MPAVDFNGQTDITVLVRETQLNGLSSQTTFRLSVSNASDAPIIESIGDRATGIGQAIDVPIRFSDADPADEHVVSVTSSDARVLITGDGQVSGSIYTLTPVDDFSRVRITVGVTDNSDDALSDTESFWLNVSNDFVAPVLSPLADVEIDEDESAALTIVFSDQNEGDDHEISVSVDGVATSVSGIGDESPATRMIEPNANANGDALVTVRVTDNRGLFDETQFELRVNPVNDAPSIEALELATREDTAVTANIPSSDIDGDALAFRVVRQPDNGQVTWSDENAGEFTYTPNANFVGSDSFSVVANDGVDDSNTATIRVEVQNENDAPTAVDAQLQTDEDVQISSRLEASDEDNEIVAFQITSLPANGRLALVNAVLGDFEYTPNPNFFGVDTFQFMAIDALGLRSAPATISITVNPINDPPRFVDPTPFEDFRIPRRGPELRFELTAVDVDNDMITYNILGLPRSEYRSRHG